MYQEIKLLSFTFTIDSFENQIITAIKKIRNDNRQSEAEKKSLKTITKEFASYIMLDDVQQKLPVMQLTH